MGAADYSINRFLLSRFVVLRVSLTTCLLSVACRRIGSQRSPIGMWPLTPIQVARCRLVDVNNDAV